MSAEANLSSVVEYNRAASRRCVLVAVRNALHRRRGWASCFLSDTAECVADRLIKLTKTVERLGDKVETCHKGQQKSWQAINEMQGRMQTIRDTVVRMTR